MKHLFSLLFVLCPLLTFAQHSRIDTLRSIILDGGKRDYVMLFAHRGDWRNAPAENSPLAFQRCIDNGIDGIEVDIQLTKDNDLVVMHDPTIDRTTTGKGRVIDYTVAELKQFNLLSPIGVITREKVMTFDEVLELAKGKALIQVDKWTSVLPLVLEKARKHGCLDHIVLRSSHSSDKIKERFGKLPDEVIYIPVVVCKGKNDQAKLDDFVKNIPTPVASFSFKHENFDILKTIPALKKKGYRIWLNSMWDTFNGGHDDELAFTDTEASYGWLLDMGADIIFTDNPTALDIYLSKKGFRNKDTKKKRRK